MKKNILNFQKMKKNKQPITWVTAYSYPTASAVEKAGIEMILVGDSGGMVELGYETTNPVTMDEMISFTKATRRGAPNTFIVGDMPQGSYEVSKEDAVRNAMRLVKEGGADAIKLEGGVRVTDKIKAIVDAGILVIGHLGLTPQSTASFGGYKVQGKSLESFKEMLKDCDAIVKAGCSMVLLEALPAKSAEQLSIRHDIPIMGIGAGALVDGQLMIMHDMIGFYRNFRPWFAKCYIPQVTEKYLSILKEQDDIKKYGIETKMDGLNALVEYALKEYYDEVKSGQFPNEEYTYPIKEDDLEELESSVHWLPVE
tara:strand:+ start:2447 stop:3382 length:936 start_codon:yes stop_codon:yes gene_type:complete